MKKDQFESFICSLFILIYNFQVVFMSSLSVTLTQKHVFKTRQMFVGFIHSILIFVLVSTYETTYLLEIL